MQPAEKGVDLLDGDAQRGELRFKAPADLGQARLAVEHAQQGMFLFP